MPGRVGCWGLCGSTLARSMGSGQADERLWPGSPRTGVSGRGRFETGPYARRGCGCQGTCSSQARGGFRLAG